MANNEKPVTTAVRTGGKLKRRALLTTTTLGACAVVTGVGVTKGPEIANYELDQFLKNELGTLEGIGLGDAIVAAELTQKLVQVIVLPVANLVATIGQGALQVLIDAVSLAQQALGLIGKHVDALSGLQTVLQSWQAGIGALPIALNAVTTADISSATKYLKALQAKVEATNKG